MKSYNGVLLVAVLVACVAVATEAGTPCRNPPSKLRPDECCDFPKDEKKHAIIEGCMATYGAQAAKLMMDKTPGPARGCCLAECIFNGTGHADFESLDTDFLMKDAEAKGLDPEWTSVLKEMDTTCRAEVKKRAEEFEAGFKLPPLSPEDKVCHPKYGFALMCSMRHMVVNCPAKFFKDTPECKEMQAFSKTCDM